MFKKISFLFLFLIALQSTGYSAFFRIDEFPTTVEAGTIAELKVTWEDILDNGKYRIIILLENFSASPSIQVKKEIFEFEKNGSETFELYIPYNTTPAQGSKFVVAAISNETESPWDDVAALTDTQTIVTTLAPTEENNAIDTIEIDINSDTTNYARHVPNQYGDGSTRYPLVIALHGSFDNGTNFITNWIDAANLFNMIVIAPSSYISDYWDIDVDWPFVEKAIQDTIANYNIDTSKILLTGFSAGGLATHGFGFEHMTLFRALAPMAGIPRNDGEYDLIEEFLSSNPNQQIPINVINGAKDSTFTTPDYNDYIALMNTYGYNLKTRFDQERGHSFTIADTLDVAEWFTNNLPPMLGQPASQIITAGDVLSFELLVKDPDNNLSKMKIKNNPKKSEFDPNTHIFTWQTWIEDLGTQWDIEVKGKDASGDKTSRTFSITVQNPNNPIQPNHASVFRSDSFDDGDLSDWINNDAQDWKIKNNTLRGKADNKDSLLSLPNFIPFGTNFTIACDIEVSKSSRNGGIVVLGKKLCLSAKKIQWDDTDTAYFGIPNSTLYPLLFFVEWNNGIAYATLYINSIKIFEDIVIENPIDQPFAFWAPKDKKITFDNLSIFEDEIQ